MKKLGQGFWYDAKTKTAKIEVIRPGTNGAARRRLTLHGITKDDAETEWLEIRGEVARGLPRKPRMFRDFLEQYLAGYLATLRSDRTRKVYQSVIDVHIRPFFDHLQLAGLRISEINRFANAMDQKTKLKALGRKGAVIPGEGLLSPSTVNGALRVLRLLLRHAFAVGAIDEVPRGKWPHRRELHRDKSFRREELVRFFAAFDDESAFRAFYGMHRKLDSSSEAVGYYYGAFRDMKPLFIVAADSGLRKGDVLALRWSSVDFPGGRITVEMRKTRQTVVCPITDAIRTALIEIKSRPLVSSEWVFIGAKTCKPIDWSTVRRWFEVAMAMAGITNRSFHGLRHGLALRLIEDGASAHVVKMQLGHTDIGTTQRYTLDASHVAEVARRLNATRVTAETSTTR